MSRALGGPAARAGRPWLALVSALVAGCGLLGGCGGQEQSGPPAARVATWVSGGGGGAAIGTLRVDAANVSQALARHDPPAAIKTVCALLTTDAGTAIGNLPTPDRALTDDLNAAYQYAASAGDDCYSGASGSTSLLARSARERARMATRLTAAVDRITAVTGHSPSTSTTRPAGTNDPFGG